MIEGPAGGRSAPTSIPVQTLNDIASFAPSKGGPRAQTRLNGGQPHVGPEYEDGWMPASDA